MAHLSPSAGTVSEDGHTLGTDSSVSAPKYGVGSGVGDEEEQGNWHGMPVVQEFTPAEVGRFMQGRRAFLKSWLILGQGQRFW